MKKKKVKLTSIEKRLLLYPPTKSTWICDNCKFYVSGKYNICVMCRTEKPANAKLVWPMYLEAKRKESENEQQ